MQNSITQIVDPHRAKEFFEDKLSFTTGPMELDQLLKSDADSVTVVDVRDSEDFAQGHVPGAINLPQGSWDSPNGLTKDKTSIIYCYSQVCHLGARACVALASHGFPVMEMEGGFAAWKDYDLEIEHESTNRLNKTR